MIILSYFEKNIKICFIDHIPNILIFKDAKYQQVIYFLSKVIFSGRSKSGGKKASKLLKQILRSILILPQGYFAIEVANCYETDFYIFFSV